jgi:hypothetical protein
MTANGGTSAAVPGNQFASTRCDRGVLAVPPSEVLVTVPGHVHLAGSVTA